MPYPITFTVVELNPRENDTTIRLQLGTEDNQILTTGDMISVHAPNAAAEAHAANDSLSAAILAVLTFTVVEVSPLIGYSIVRIRVGSTDTAVASTSDDNSDHFNIATSDEIAALNAVDSPLVLSAP
jgi:hypothetical protein